MSKRLLPEEDPGGSEEPPLKRHDASIPGLYGSQEDAGPHVDPDVGPDTSQDGSLNTDSPIDAEAKRFICPWEGCSKRYNRPSRLETHVRMHTGHRPFKCDYEGCTKDYAEQRHLTHHIQAAHLDDRQYPCQHPGCGKAFHNKTRLNRHAIVHKGGDHRPRCTEYPPCDQKFRHKTALERHVRADHMGLPPYVCSSCPEAFNSPSSLRCHVNKVHGASKFWCETCPVDETTGLRPGFTQLSQLKAHMRNEHLNCMFCATVCASEADLVKHNEVAHGGGALKPRKTIACPFEDCPGQFSRKSGLNAHIKTCHDKQRFVCGEEDMSRSRGITGWDDARGCGALLTSKAGLEDHIKYIHLKMKRPTNKYREKQQRAPAEGSHRLNDVSGASVKRTLRCSVARCDFYCIRYHEMDKHMASQHPEMVPSGQPGRVARAAPQPPKPQTQELQAPQQQSPQQQSLEQKAMAQDATGQGTMAQDTMGQQALQQQAWEQHTMGQQTLHHLALENTLQQPTLQQRAVEQQTRRYETQENQSPGFQAPVEQPSAQTQQVPELTASWTSEGIPGPHPPSQAQSTILWDEPQQFPPPLDNNQQLLFDGVENPAVHGNANAAHPHAQYPAGDIPNDTAYDPMGNHAPTGQAINFEPPNTGVGFGTNLNNVPLTMIPVDPLLTGQSSYNFNDNDTFGDNEDFGPSHVPGHNDHVHLADAFLTNNPSSTFIEAQHVESENQNVSQHLSQDTPREMGEGSGGFPTMEAAGQMVGVNA